MRRLAVWVRAHAVAALALVAAGSLVNSHQAALSVPDWPLSYGRLLLPVWSGNTAWEQTHRLTAALVVVIHIAVLLSLRRARREEGVAVRIRPFARLTTVLLVVQILLGGAVVLLLNPPWIGALHVVLAQLFAAASVVLARAVGGAPTGAPSSRLLTALPWLLVLQIALGAVSRHPPAGKGAFIATLLGHAVVGLVLVGLLIAAGVGRLRRGERRRGWALVGLAVGQLLVGLAVFFIAPEPLAETWPPPAGFPAFHAAHHLLAALLLGTVAKAPRLRRRERGGRGLV
jgi:hypothetical protein